jgi:AcrR family transcriptional regulator
MARKTTADDTRTRLIEAGCRLFAEKGYRDTTVAAICREARANIASVNYHFGGKAKLYAAVWRHLFEESARRHPPDGGVPADAPPEARLRGRIGAMVRRVTTRGGRMAAIMDKEMANPTGLLREAVRNAIGPRREQMHALMRELLGPEASEDEVELCAMSTINQAIALWRRARRKTPRFRKWMTQQGAERLADHITRFSLGGIAAVRARGGKKG